jgi:putative hemolysin
MAQFALAQPDADDFDLSVAGSLEGVSGWRLTTADAEVRPDALDPYCLHLLARDRTTGALAARTRLLTQEQSMLAGGFRAGRDFRLEPLLGGRRLFVEASRTMVHPDYRGTNAVHALWSGVEPFLVDYGYDHLFTAVEIPLSAGPGAVRALVRDLLDERGCSPELRVAPRLPLPNMCRGQVPACAPPAGLDALRCRGARVCGEASWDPRRGSAVVLLLLDGQERPADSTRSWDMPPSHSRRR